MTPVGKCRPQELRRFEIVMLQFAAIVICGGQSSRMGLSKAHLPFGDQSMLSRVVCTLDQIARPVIVVGAAQQVLPPVPVHVVVRRDRREGRGPLEGIAAGLEALETLDAVAFITSCDVPLLVPDFVRRVCELLTPDVDIVVPWDGTHHHPLAAAYRMRVLPAVQSLLAADRLRPVFLFDQVPTRRVHVDELRDVDPELVSLENVNHPRDYLAALKWAGLTAPPEVWQQLHGDRQQ